MNRFRITIRGNVIEDELNDNEVLENLSKEIKDLCDSFEVNNVKILVEDEHCINKNDILSQKNNTKPIYLTKKQVYTLYILFNYSNEYLIKSVLCNDFSIEELETAYNRIKKIADKIQFTLQQFNIPEKEYETDTEDIIKKLNWAKETCGIPNGQEDKYSENAETLAINKAIKFIKDYPELFNEWNKENV